MEDLKIGVKVVVKRRRNSSIEIINRETKTMYITEHDRTRVYKKDNSIVGSPYDYVFVATQKDFDAIEKSKIARGLSEFNFDKLDLEKLRKIKEITVDETR